MVHLKLKAMLGFVVFDILSGLIILARPHGSAALQNWLWFNLIVIASSISLFIGFRLRNQRNRRKFSYKHSFGRNGENHYRTPHLTLDGDSVKSGGEKLIANYLHDHNIIYEYEKPVTDYSNRKISRPDFYLPEYDLYIEYWGMINTKDKMKRQEYIRGMKWKIAKYHENGVKFISIYPEDLQRLDSIIGSHVTR